MHDSIINTNHDIISITSNNIDADTNINDNYCSYSIMVIMTRMRISICYSILQYSTCCSYLGPAVAFR